MNQVVQNYKSGELVIEAVSLPARGQGAVRVQTSYSVVSSGTEGTAVREAAMSLVEKARARPDQVSKVLDTVRRQGLLATYQAVMNRLDSLTPLGYSCSGTVIEVGAGVEEFRVGQLVACGGVGYANHAEVNVVPRNLVVPVPEGVTAAEAACTTVGSVALQGFRQSELMLGDVVVVVGLGLVGQLYCQIARAAGCRVVAIDLNPERVNLARQLGADAACTFDPQTAAAAVEAVSHGLGADAAVLAAGTSSNEPLELAVQLVRDRGRIVNVGKAKIDVPYEPFFKKDLTLVFSRSYGPGRYDPNYEEKGIDYPIGYVKWTERRNMAAFLDLVAQKKLNLGPILGEPVPFEKAPEAYAALREGKAGLATLFVYPGATEPVSMERSVATAAARVPARPAARVVLSCIGAGNYANTKLLPVLAKRPDVRLQTVATTKGTTGKTAADRFGFVESTTDVSRVFDNPEVNAVLIATPHGSHASLVARALRAGKAVFVEKPLAISQEQLDELLAAVRESGNDRLQVGFNRRFAPLTLRVRDAFREVLGPRSVVIRVNAGKLGGGKWLTDVSESGGRIIGEACHFVDLAACLIGEEPVEVSGFRTGSDPDDATMTLRYPNGSVATIVYTTSGGVRLAKEYLELHAGGMTAVLDDFRRADWYGLKHRKLGSGGQDKGQAAELDRFCEAVVKGGPMPIALSSLVATTRACFQILRSVQTGRPEPVDGGQ